MFKLKSIYEIYKTYKTKESHSKEKQADTDSCYSPPGLHETNAGPRSLPCLPPAPPTGSVLHCCSCLLVATTGARPSYVLISCLLIWF